MRLRASLYSRRPVPWRAHSWRGVDAPAGIADNRLPGFTWGGEG